MQSQVIAEVGLDDDHRMYVRPADGNYEHIYRAAMEVYWDGSTRRLSHPRPRNLSPVQWYQQIIAAVADEYGIDLRLTEETAWSNVSPDIRTQIEAGF